MFGAESAGVRWRKSSYSNGSGGDCVEVGPARGATLVRDSKQRGTGPVLGFPADGWHAFTTGIRTGSLGR